MIAAILVFIVWVLFCCLLFGYAGIPIGIASFVGVVVYLCKQAKADAEKEQKQEPVLAPKPEPFCTPITTDDILASYCADKVVNERFKI